MHRISKKICIFIKCLFGFMPYEYWEFIKFIQKDVIFKADSSLFWHWKQSRLNFLQA